MTNVRYAGANAITRKKAEKGILDILRPLIVPVAAAAFFVHRYLKNRKAKPAASTPATSKQRQATKARTKPRREYKIKRDGELDLDLEGHDHTDLLSAVGLSPDDEAHMLHEDEVDMLAQAQEAGPQQGGEFMQMLKSMGFKMVMPNDGSGRVYMVPPGAEAEGDDADGGAVEDEDEDDPGAFGDYMVEGDDIGGMYLAPGDDDDDLFMPEGIVPDADGVFEEGDEEGPEDEGYDEDEDPDAEEEEEEEQ